MTADPRPTGLPCDDATLEAATDWLLQLQAAPGDAALRAAHDRWLGLHPDHAAAWLAVQRSWAVTGHLQPRLAALDSPSAQILPLRPRLRPLSARPVRLLAVALAACLAIVVLAPGAQLRWQADAVTATGETRALRLEDGSTITLGGDSAVATAFTPAQRRVALLRGEAHFQVTADAARPFVIAADTATVTVVGTAFDVALDEQAIAVTVASGIVQVQPAMTDAAAALHLRAGERVSIDRQSAAATVARLAPEDVGAWRAGRLVLHDLPLSEAIARLGRYHRGQILALTGGAPLAQQRVSGIFDLDDPARALRGMLAAGSPELRAMKVREISPYLIVLTK